MPLVRRIPPPASSPAVRCRMNPAFMMEGLEMLLHLLDIVSVAPDQLGSHFGSLAEAGQCIADALEELLTRSWG